MGTIAGERRRGTLGLVLSRPVSRAAVLWAKFVALGMAFGLATGLAVLAAWLYSALFFAPQAALPWGQLGAILWLSADGPRRGDAVRLGRRADAARRRRGRAGVHRRDVARLERRRRSPGCCRSGSPTSRGRPPSRRSSPDLVPAVTIARVAGRDRDRARGCVVAVPPDGRLGRRRPGARRRSIARRVVARLARGSRRCARRGAAAAVRTEAGVPDSSNGMPTWSTRPRLGCSSGTRLPSASACGEAKRLGDVEDRAGRDAGRVQPLQPGGAGSRSRSARARIGMSSSRRSTRSPFVANRASVASSGQPDRRPEPRPLALAPDADAISPSAVANVSYGTMLGWALPRRTGAAPVTSAACAWLTSTASVLWSSETSMRCPPPGVRPRGAGSARRPPAPARAAPPAATPPRTAR